MPYVENASLTSQLDKEGLLSIEEAVRLTREAADALEYALRKGVIHRDINRRTPPSPAAARALQILYGQSAGSLGRG
jgi:serine/threonine protein kinase